MAYRAEIEIGVRGTERLRDLRRSLDDLSARVNKLDQLANVFKAPIQSVLNYNKSLQEAAEVLQKVELGTKEETQAIQSYVRALGEANEAQSRQIRLIQTEIDLRTEQVRLQKLTAAGIFETTRYARPIGPGPALPAGGFPSEGMLPIPGAARMQKNIGKFSENLALGAGFPLLFGGGPGAIGGSILGSFFGTGFGGQILGGALGQALDQAIQKTAKLGTALQTLNISALEQSGIRINANLETQIGLMRQVGDLSSAQLAVQQQVFSVTGALPGTVEGISDAVNLLGAAWGEFTASIGVTLGIIGAPFVAALAAIINSLNTALRGLNLILTGLATGIKLAGEWAIRLLAGEAALRKIQDTLRQNNAELERARAAYAPILAALNGEVILTREILDLEKQKTTENKTRNAYLSYQQSVLRINADIDEKIRDEQGKQTAATKQLVEEKVRLLNVTRQYKVEEAELAFNLEKQRIIQEENAKRAREAEQAAQKELQTRIQILNLQSQVLSVFVEQTQAQIARETFLKGELGGLEAQLQAQDKIAFAKETALERDRQAALLGTKNVEEQNLINAAYVRRLNLLQQQNDLEAAQAERRKNRLKLEEKLAATQRQQDIEDSVTSVRQQQQKVSFDIAGFTSPADLLQQEKQLFEQRIRARETLLPLEREITKLTEEINSSSLDANALKTKQDDLAAQQAKLVLMQQELGLLDQLEHRQLRLQQFFERYGQLIQTASGEIANAVTFGVAEMVRGTKTAEQVFADFLNAIGNALISAAQQMIATYIAIGIAKMFAGLGGGGSANTGTSAGGLPGSSLQGGFANPLVGQYSTPLAFAEGGYVTGPTSAIVGEGGESEYIIPASKMRSAMSRYAAGARGSAVIPAGDDTSGGGGTATMAPAAIDVRYTVERINSVDYVTADQFRTGMAQAAQQGATQGEQRTLRRLQQSRATRSRLGMN